MKQRRICKVLAIMASVIALLAADCGIGAVCAHASDADKSYIYDENRVAKHVPDAYDHYLSVALRADGLSAVKPSDLFVTEQNVYVTDYGNNRILILDDQFRMSRTITELTDKNGVVSAFKQPNGIFAYEDGRMLVADTGNNRIVLCDADGSILLQIDKPGNMVGVSAENEFLPLKVAADTIGRIYVVAENINNGILQFDSEGVFIGYLGAPTVKADFLTLLWKSIFSKEQQSQMESFVPTEYNNLFIDEEDFLWGTIGTEPESPIRKLNAMGNDVLARNGLFAPQGDLVAADAASSVIVDVATNPNGMYSMLDQTRGRIFTYDVNGNLLFAFGNKGEREENFAQPIAITYFRDMLLVLDTAHNSLQVFRPTAYGELLFEAVDAQYTGDFDAANTLWSQIASENSNLKYAFSGLGNAELSKGNYEQALTYFKYAGDTVGYSNAKEQLRKQQMKTGFPFLFGGAAVLIVGLILNSLIRKFLRYYRGEAS